MTYSNRLLEIGITLLEPFTGAKSHHLMKCNNCSYEWTATPLSKTQAFKKYGYNGCPECNKVRIEERNSITRQQNIQTVLDRGFIINSPWDGRNSIGAECIPLIINVTNTRCGHTFDIAVSNLLRRNVECAICGPTKRITSATAWSKANSEEWQKTATPWRAYKAKVSNITKISYRQNKDKINPNNLPFGLAGTVGAHHLDHIVPMRYCFNNNIPEELCAHPDNLQILGWRENIGSRDNLKEYVPNIFVDFISVI